MDDRPSQESAGAAPLPPAKPTAKAVPESSAQAMVKPFRFLGLLEIERKTDILALAAFLLALGGVVFQTYHFFRGASVTLFSPEQITLVAYRYKAPDGPVHLRIASRMAYVNAGQMGYTAVIKRESVRFALTGHVYEQYWQAFTALDAEGQALKTNFQSDAHPQPIEGGSAVSHETYFAPRTVPCRKEDSGCRSGRNFLTLDDFVKSVAPGRELKFELRAELYGDKNQQAACTVNLGEDVLRKLREKGWVAPRCKEDQGKEAGSEPIY